MFKCFEDRGYPRTTLHRAMDIADNTSGEHLLWDSKGNKTRNRVKNRNKNSTTNYNKFEVGYSPQTPVFSTPFSSEFNKIKKFVLKYLPVLSSDPIYAEILSKGVKTVLH